MRYSYKSFPFGGLVLSLLLLMTLHAQESPCQDMVNTQPVPTFPPILFCPAIVNPPDSQMVCAGSSTAAIVFNGSAWRYTWANSNPAIGLPASGTGDISSFLAVNTTGIPQTATITVTPERPTRAYVANNYSNDVSVIDVATNTVVKTIPVGIEPYGVSASQDGTSVYVTNFSSNTVSVIDAATDTTTATIPVGSSPTGVSVTPDGSKVYVANNFSDNVSVIDAATSTVIDTIPVEAIRWALELLPTEARCMWPFFFIERQCD